MTCKNEKQGAVHSGLCGVTYPCTRIASSTDIRASHQRDCSLGGGFVALGDVHQTLGYEASMDLINLDDLIQFVDKRAKFGTYCNIPRSSGRAHFCVDKGRRTVEGRRLSWLWVFPDGNVRPAHKILTDNPTYVWTKQQIIDAYRAAKNPGLPMFTRHVDKHSELAITFCLPLP
ncbi:hypothetical protein EUZ85_18775 [Hahella sp. KA22]|uniref:hypothetical protein n=1 Tax=Hahella sp. KA22 TaxID=1628392 RepID=UPI000FDE7BD7|nr:hypothetical protein [Hahella sp. KA22]AZZ92657.1 hypothetical protein ENC22_16200 [Hahella sp. KA22]QAY56030.1 hypothetical protein EUZ85_18775 [Hahella sp. KA22]